MHNRHANTRTLRAVMAWMLGSLSMMGHAELCEVQNEQKYTVTANQLTYVLEDLPLGVNEFSVAVRDTFGLLSAPSNIGTKTITPDVTTATLRWTAPTTRVDNTPLLPEEIVGYEIYHKLPQMAQVECGTTPEPATETDFNTGLYANDGAVSAEGVCLAQEFIFAGRPMRCDLAGQSTGYQNCCKDRGVVYTDTSGSLVATVAGAEVLSQTASAAAIAYESYAVSMASAVPASEAASMAAADFAAALSPATLGIGIAVAALVQYFTQSCDQTSMETAMLNGSGYCYELGEFCRKDNAFGCVQRSKSYCCFNSKMARLIHQQGRAQLKDIAWGTTDAPNCRGFTPAEFQAIDFSQIDFSTYYADLVPDTTLMEQRVNDTVSDFIDATQ